MNKQLPIMRLYMVQQLPRNNDLCRSEHADHPLGWTTHACTYRLDVWSAVFTSPLFRVFLFANRLSGTPAGYCLPCLYTDRLSDGWIVFHFFAKFVQSVPWVQRVSGVRRVLTHCRLQFQRNRKTPDPGYQNDDRSLVWNPSLKFG